MEADMIRDYFEWMRDQAERERYERARNAADRAADRY